MILAIWHYCNVVPNKTILFEKLVFFVIGMFNMNMNGDNETNSIDWEAIKLEKMN